MEPKRKKKKEETTLTLSSLKWAKINFPAKIPKIFAMIRPKDAPRKT